MANSVGLDQTGFTLFASILNSLVMLGNYLQQMTSADDIFRCISSGSSLFATVTILGLVNSFPQPAKTVVVCCLICLCS